MEEHELYKYFLKTKVIFQIVILYVPAVLFTLYGDVLVSSWILGITDFYGFVHLFSFSWWKILPVITIQYLVCCFFFGLWTGLKKVVIRNKDFFLS